MESLVFGERASTARSRDEQATIGALRARVGRPTCPPRAAAADRAQNTCVGKQLPVGARARAWQRGGSRALE